jgi:branched-chain amino acid transport system ATP-binding protein
VGEGAQVAVRGELVVHEDGHALVRSAEPGEEWSWCYADEVAAILDDVGLGRLAGERAGNLSHGDQRALELAISLAMEPKLLLLDEPTAGMSPEEARAMMDLIERLNQDRTVIVVEHRMKLVMGISTRIIVLHHGKLLAEGAPDDIRAHDEVRRVYLGQTI